MCKCGSLTPYVSDCCCGPKPLTLEVGKVYVTKNGEKVKIVYKSTAPEDKAPFLGVYNRLESQSSRWYVPDGHWSVYPENGDPADIVKEFKEPVVHKRDVVWYRYKENSNKAFTTTLEVGESWNPTHLIILKRETVSYTE